MYLLQSSLGEALDDISADHDDKGDDGEDVSPEEKHDKTNLTDAVAMLQRYFKLPLQFIDPTLTVIKDTELEFIDPTRTVIKETDCYKPSCQRQVNYSFT